MASVDSGQPVRSCQCSAPVSPFLPFRIEADRIALTLALVALQVLCSLQLSSKSLLGHVLAFGMALWAASIQDTAVKLCC